MSAPTNNAYQAQLEAIKKMQAAQALMGEAKDQLERQTFNGMVKNGLVRCEIDAAGRPLSIIIDPEAMREGEERLAKLVLDALSNAQVLLETKREQILNRLATEAGLDVATLEKLAMGQGKA